MMQIHIAGLSHGFNPSQKVRFCAGCIERLEVLINAASPPDEAMAAEQKPHEEAFSV